MVIPVGGLMICAGLTFLGLSPAIHGLAPGLWPGVLGPLFCPIILGLMTFMIFLGLATTNDAISPAVGDALPLGAT